MVFSLLRSELLDSCFRIVTNASCDYSSASILIMLIYGVFGCLPWACVFPFFYATKICISSVLLSRTPLYYRALVSSLLWASTDARLRESHSWLVLYQLPWGKCLLNAQSSAFWGVSEIWDSTSLLWDTRLLCPLRGCLNVKARARAIWHSGVGARLVIKHIVIILKGCTKICKDVQRCTKMYKDVQRCNWLRVAWISLAYAFYLPLKIFWEPNHSETCLPL